MKIIFDGKRLTITVYTTSLHICRSPVECFGEIFIMGDYLASLTAGWFQDNDIFSALIKRSISALDTNRWHEMRMPLCCDSSFTMIS